MVTVKELKAKLDGMLDDDIIIIQKDGEGSEYSPMHSMHQGTYFADTKWYGDVYTDCKNTRDGKRCVVLVPAN